MRHNKIYTPSRCFFSIIIRDESNPEASVWNSVENFTSVKTHVLKITSVTKLYSDIRRCYAEQQEICLLYLTAESRILQHCLCQ